ncbi:MAG: NdvB protein [Pseudomonadota bacterium]
MDTSALLTRNGSGSRVELHCPLTLPKAGAFLWNPRMLVQFNCRGYAVAQHMQPEPSKYSHGPVLEAKTFMQPEMPYYAHHPGRFVFVKDEITGDQFSAPHEPMRQTPDRFLFSVGPADLRWAVSRGGIEIEMEVSLPLDDVAELWTISVRNRSRERRQVSVYPYFSIGYMSWMNQSARYDPALGALVACSVTPYQKLEEYPRVRRLKDCTYLLHGTPPSAWETSSQVFEGEGGLTRPGGVARAELGNGDAGYDSPVAVYQYRLALEPSETRSLSFVFGPAGSDAEIAQMRERYLGPRGFEGATRQMAQFVEKGQGAIQIQTPDHSFDSFVNHWLNRQVHYHGQANRLTTDPQTRNFLQDTMGQVYIEPEVVGNRLVQALAQQLPDGGMPEGIILEAGAELKYINQIPHTDHCVWLPICLQIILDETGDWALLDRPVQGEADQQQRSLFDRVTRAMRWLINNCDHRGLSLINQGDWCDPMNMVGPAGRGVSGWLSMATVYALNVWEGVARQAGRNAVAEEMAGRARLLEQAIQQYLWDGDWFARGITDDDKTFGVQADPEGRIFLNPQSWAVLAGIATDDQSERLLKAVREQLETDFGAMILAPAYTRMREDIGRVTQKYPGSAENGAIYNHAAMFYVYALYRLNESEAAYQQLLAALPGPDPEDLLRRGQLPVFVPNYYRGAVHQLPDAAGRSSQLFHTGAASWFYRIVIEELFGLKGCRDGLRLRPQLPERWPRAQVTRRFRGAEYQVVYRREGPGPATRMFVDGQPLAGDVLPVEAGRTYRVNVLLGAEPT